MLEKLKGRLRILDEDEDPLLLGIISQGKSELDEMMGVDLDYEVEGPEQSLLLEYCRYAYNNALEFFEDNFHKQIVRLQLRVAIEHDKQENEGTTTF